MNLEEAKLKLSKYGQEQILRYYDELSDDDVIKIWRGDMDKKYVVASVDVVNIPDENIRQYIYDHIDEDLPDLTEEQKELINRAIVKKMPDIFIRQMFTMGYNDMKEFFDSYYNE